MLKGFSIHPISIMIMIIAVLGNFTVKQLKTSGDFTQVDQIPNIVSSSACNESIGNFIFTFLGVPLC